MKIIQSLCTIAMVIGICWLALQGCDGSNPKSALERAYFEGQKDALNGDIRIKLNRDSTYIWTKSPWDSGTPPSFTPTYLDSKP